MLVSSGLWWVYMGDGAYSRCVMLGGGDNYTYLIKSCASPSSSWSEANRCTTMSQSQVVGMAVNVK